MSKGRAAGTHDTRDVGGTRACAEHKPTLKVMSHGCAEMQDYRETKVGKEMIPEVSSDLMQCGKKKGRKHLEVKVYILLSYIIKAMNRIDASLWSHTYSSTYW